VNNRHNRHCACYEDCNDRICGTRRFWSGRSRSWRTNRLAATEYDKHGYDLLNKHDYENARRYFDAAIRTDPHMWTAYYNRVVTFCQQKKWSAALQDLNSSVRLKPSFFDATYKRSLVHRKLGNYKGSLADLDILITLSSKVHNSLEAEQSLNDRAWILATCPEASIRNGQLAVADAMKACKLNDWTLGSSIDTVAAAYAEVAILIRPSVTNSRRLTF
jgi:tetratricopeptide (TPR) repeat protein